MKKRDDEEFVQIATARATHLLRTGYLLTGDWHLAEDLVQEALGKAYAAWRGRTKIDNPPAYIHTVLVRTYYSHRRRRTNSEVPQASMPETGQVDADVTLRLSLLDGLARLNPKDRAVVVLRYWEDRSVAETADILGITGPAVKNQTIRALAKLRDVLGPRYADFVEGTGPEDSADLSVPADAASITEGVSHRV